MQKDKYQREILKRIRMGKLTTEKIIEIHDDIIKKYGGTGGIINQGTVDHLIYQLNRENDVFRKAAITLETIITKHPFFIQA